MIVFRSKVKAARRERKNPSLSSSPLRYVTKQQQLNKQFVFSRKKNERSANKNQIFLRAAEK